MSEKPVNSDFSNLLKSEELKGFRLPSGKPPVVATDNSLLSPGASGAAPMDKFRLNSDLSVIPDAPNALDKGFNCPVYTSDKLCIEPGGMSFKSTLNPPRQR